MLKINRTLIQLNNAIRLANSPLPQEKALSVILFDQLIEIILYEIANSPLPIQSGSKPNSNIKKAASQHFDKLLKFVKSVGLLSETDEALLAFTHNIRNGIYHEADESEDKINIALSIYFHFIQVQRELFLKTNSPTALSTDAGYEQIDFGQGLKKNDPLWFMNTDEYFSSAFDFLIDKIPSLPSFPILAFNYLRDTIIDIEGSLKFAEEGHKNYSFYNAIAASTIGEDVPILRQYANENRRPKNLDSILITAAFIRRNEEFLTAIGDGRTRLVISRKLYKEFRKGLKGKYQHWVNLGRISNRIAKLQNERIDTAIKNFININELISTLQQDASLASLIFGGYEMWLYDLYRGK